MVLFQQVARRVGRKSREFLIKIGLIDGPRFYLQSHEAGHARQCARKQGGRRYRRISSRITHKSNGLKAKNSHYDLNRLTYGPL